MAVLQWIQDLPISVAIAESDSLWWGYAWWLFLDAVGLRLPVDIGCIVSPWWLFVHAVGMGLTAGIGFIVCLRLLGVGRQIPLSSLRVLFRLFWVGFYLNLVSGTLLFMTDATGIARVWELYAKLVCLALAMVAMSRLRRFVETTEG